MPRFSIKSIAFLTGITAALLAIMKSARHTSPWLMAVPVAIYTVLLAAWFVHAKIGGGKKL
jgi:hypothetical protein